jgi:hypothetical protein
MIEERKDKSNENITSDNTQQKIAPAVTCDMNCDCFDIDSESDSITRNEYIRDMLENNIHVATETIDELYKEVGLVDELPNDCLNIEIDGQMCYNKDYKIDIISGHMHTIGYMACLKHESELMLGLLCMTEEEFQEYLKEEIAIEIENKQTLDDLMSKIKNGL